MEEDGAIRAARAEEPRAQGDRRPNWRQTPPKKGQVSNRVSSVQETGTNSKAAQLPNISAYNFSVNEAGVISALQSLGDKVRWPKKSNKPDEKKDKTKYCAFHDDHGHWTDECYQLKKQVAYLLRKGLLDHLLSKSHNQDVANPLNDAQPKAPEIRGTLNVILGGSDICGLTYSAAKRFARIDPPPMTKPGATGRRRQPGPTISFDDEEGEEEEHHDALVISLHVSNMLVRRVLVDNGSMANVIFKEALQQIGPLEQEVDGSPRLLVGFSGETRYTEGEVLLTTWAEGVNMAVRFNVVDAPSPYNMILGTPWIHKMKAVPSTFHQMLKFPSPWGIMTIKGEKKIARECYRNSLKRKTQAA